METAGFITRLLDVMEGDIAPKTRREVERGNKLFGAAILKKSDLSLVIAESNNEVENPLWHGEVHAIKKLYELPSSSRPEPKDCVFLATHEPCSLCLSAITWSGYDNFYFFFSHEDSRDSFNIPHDLRILQEVFHGGYNAKNAYWQSHNIVHMIARLDDDSDRQGLLERVKSINALYAEISAVYQAHKGDKGIPLA